MATNVWGPAASQAQLIGMQLPIHAIGTPSASAPNPRRRGNRFGNYAKPFTQGSGVASNAGTRGESQNLSWNVAPGQLYNDPMGAQNAEQAALMRATEDERQRQTQVRGVYAPGYGGSQVWYPGAN